MVCETTPKYVFLTNDSQIANVVVGRLSIGGSVITIALASRAGDGFYFYEFAKDGSNRRTTMRKSTGSPRVDDIAIDEKRMCVYTLDAWKGSVSTYEVLKTESIGAQMLRLRLVQDGVQVDTNPYNGIAASSGAVIISGGTSRLTFFRERKFEKKKNQTPNLKIFQ